MAFYCPRCKSEALFMWCPICGGSTLQAEPHDESGDIPADLSADSNHLSTCEKCGAQTPTAFGLCQKCGDFHSEAARIAHEANTTTAKVNSPIGRSRILVAVAAMLFPSFATYFAVINTYVQGDRLGNGVSKIITFLVVGASSCLISSIVVAYALERRKMHAAFLSLPLAFLIGLGNYGLMHTGFPHSLMPHFYFLSRDDWWQFDKNGQLFAKVEWVIYDREFGNPQPRERLRLSPMFYRLDINQQRYSRINDSDTARLLSEWGKSQFLGQTMRVRGTMLEGLDSRPIISIPGIDAILSPDESYICFFDTITERSKLLWIKDGLITSLPDSFQEPRRQFVPTTVGLYDPLSRNQVFNPTRGLYDPPMNQVIDPITFDIRLRRRNYGSVNSPDYRSHAGNSGFQIFPDPFIDDYLTASWFFPRLLTPWQTGWIGFFPWYWDDRSWYPKHYDLKIDHGTLPV